MKTLTEMAAEAVAKVELDSKADFQACDIHRKLIDQAKAIVVAERAKKSVKEADVKACLAQSKAVESLLLKRKGSWEERLGQLAQLRPQLAQDHDALAQFHAIKAKAEASHAKYAALLALLKQLQSEIPKSKALGLGLKVTMLITHTNELVGLTSRAEGFLA